MKKLFVIAAMVCAMSLTLGAAEGKKAEKKKMTAEQKALMEEITKKYDENGNGKLEKEERAKINAEDKAKMKEAGLMGGGAKGEKGKKKEK